MVDVSETIFGHESLMPLQYLKLKREKNEINKAVGYCIWRSKVWLINLDKWKMSLLRSAAADDDDGGRASDEWLGYNLYIGLITLVPPLK